MIARTIRPVALIIDATHGTGLATAWALAKDHSYHVIIGTRNIKAGEKIVTEFHQEGLQASVLELDLTSETSVKLAIATIECEHNCLDVLVNNVDGADALSEGLLPLLREARAGPPRVVFVSGSADKSLGMTTSYDASRTDVKALTTSFDRKLADVGGKSNAVCSRYAGAGVPMKGPQGENTEDSVRLLVRMATIGADGPSATFSNSQGIVPW